MRGQTRPLDAETLLAEARWLSRLARKLVRDDAEAQDVVQSAWMAALEAAPAGEERLRPWLARVVRNFASQSRRGEAHRTERERASAKPERSPSAAETAERIESQRILVDALDALEEPYRTTVTLRYLEGLSAAQIARRQGIPPGTARWRLKQGLDLLRARLDKRFGGERRTWALALAPMLRRPPLAGILGGGAAAVVEGVVMMNTVMKLGVAAALVLAASVGVWLSVDREVPLAAPSVANAPAEMKLDAAVGTSTEAGLAPARSSPARETVPVEASGPQPVSVSSESTARLRARCVDPQGTPVPGVRFELPYLKGGRGESSSDGRVAIDLEIPAASTSARLVASLAGRETRFERVVLDRGKTTELGDFVLERGGAVAGVVVDAEGNPVAGAQILVTKPEFASRLDALRRLGPFLGREDDPPVPTGTTDAEGRFHVDGVPARSVRVWAGAERTLFAFTDAFELAADETRSDLRLTLPSLAPDDVLEGVVLDPEGKPVPWANVITLWRGAAYQVVDSTETGADGRFRIRVREKVAHDLRVLDRDRRWPEILRAGVQPGTTGIELRFAPTGGFELVVRGRGQDVVEEFSAMLLSADGQQIFEQGEVSEHPGGRVRFRIPAAPFVVEILARGYARARLGPIDPSSVPASLACELDVLPGVRGRVVAEGKPVAGATLEVHRVARRGMRIVADGFPSRLDPQVVDSVRSDGEGRFDFTVRDAGTYAIVAESEALATTELSPIEIDPAIGVDGLEVAMTRGGSIEGRVLLPGGRDPAGTIVGVSRGDGYPRTTRAGADGSFRFDRLAPGRWNVTRARMEVRDRGGSSTFGIADEPTSVPWNCTVAEGRVTRFDLDLRDDRACVLAASVSLGGRALQDWTLSLQALGTEALHMSGAALDAQGHARVEAEEPGTYSAVLRTAGDSFDATFSGPVALVRGETPWQLDVAAGGIEGRVEPSASDPLPQLWYQWTRDGSPSFNAWITADSEGRFRLPFVPAGRGTIRRREGPDPDSRRWTTGRAVDVVAGETLRLDLD